MLGNHIQLLCRSLLAGLVAGLLALGALYASVLQYPANPPAVGDPDTINEPTLLWLASVVLGLVAIVVAVAVAKALATQDLHTVRIAGPAFAFLVVVGLGYLVLPSVDEVGESFPSMLSWEFRAASFAVQLGLWAALGVVLAYLTERASRRTPITV